MFDSIRKFFDAHLQETDEAGTDAHADHELRLACAALLLEVMQADFETSTIELEAVRNALRTAYGLDDAELEELLELAHREHDAAVCLHAFTRAINDRLTPERKSQIVELMWRVAYIDGRLDRYEEHVVRKVADLIYVPHSEFIRTKLIAAESLPAS